MADSPADEADNGFDKHKPTISRLYLEEKKSCEDVREIMAQRYQFTASTKMYKSRFKKWGWRKNIRFDQPVILHSDACYLPIKMPAPVSAPTPSEREKDTTSNDKPLPGSTGLIVRQKRLEEYLRRREHRYRARLRNDLAAVPTVPGAIQPPDRLWASQAVLIHIQQYLLRRYTGHLNTTDSLMTMWTNHVESALFSWDRYTYAVAEALETPGKFQDAMVLLRRAPQELSMMLASQPIITTADLCVFIIYMTRPRAYIDAQERKQFYKVLRALFTVATHSFNWPPDHPMLRIFQGFVRADDDDLHDLAREAWKLGTATMDVFLDDLGSSGAPCLTKASAGTQRASPDFICLVDETMRRARAGYHSSKPWCMDSLYNRPEVLESHEPHREQSVGIDATTPDPLNSQPAPSVTNEAPIDETVEKICWALYRYKPVGGAKIVSMKALFDAHRARAQNDPVERLFAEKYLRRCILAICDEFGKQDPLVERYLTELENALLAWGDTEKAIGVMRWREDLLGRSRVDWEDSSPAASSGVLALDS